MKPDPNKFRITTGTVQCMVVRMGDETLPLLSHHFGRPEYDREKPILSDSLREQAQPIVDALNANTLDWETAKKKLDRISY